MERNKMNQLTYLVSIKTFFEKDNDYISAFSYIVLQVLTKHKQTNTQIQEKINKQFSIRIPTSFIKTCLKRLKKIGITSVEMSVLSERGEELLQNISTQVADANREINGLVDKIQTYISSKNIHATNEEILKNLIKLIESKTQDIASGFKKISFTENKNSDFEITRQIVHFLIEVEERDAIAFKTLRDIGQGVILHAILNKEDPDKIAASFSPLTIFLDTNVVFGLLELADYETNSTCKEIVALVRQHKNIELRLFPFTVEEIRNFIEAQMKHYNSASANVRYICLSGARKILSKKSNATLKLLQDNFVRDLNKKFGIVVSNDYSDNLYTSEQINELNKLKIDYENLYKMPSQPSLEHDVNAFCWVKKLRKGKVYSIEDSKYLFLTLDNKLFRWVANKHQTSRPEVITIEAFTAILWIKTPSLNSNLPIHNLIAGCREKLLIRQDVWDAIITALKKYKNLDSYEHDAVSIRILQSRSLLEQIEGVSALSEEKALACIETADASLKEQEEKRNRELSDLKKKNSESEQEKQDYLKTIGSQTEKLKHYENRDKKIAQFLTIVLTIVSYILLAFLIWKMYDVGWLGKFNGSIDIKGIGLTEVPRKTCFCILVFIIWGIWFAIYHHCHLFTKTSNWIYTRINETSK